MGEEAQECDRIPTVPPQGGPRLMTLRGAPPPPFPPLDRFYVQVAPGLALAFV